MAASHWRPNWSAIGIIAPFFLALAGYAISQSNDVAVLKANNAVQAQQIADLDKRLDRLDAKEKCR